ncbi:hypothetical protein IGI42_002691 [Enterococcus sp. AZ109]
MSHSSSTKEMLDIIALSLRTFPHLLVEESIVQRANC